MQCDEAVILIPYRHAVMHDRLAIGTAVSDEGDGTSPRRQSIVGSHPFASTP